MSDNSRAKSDRAETGEDLQILEGNLYKPEAA